MVPASPDYALGSGETFANFSPKFWARAAREKRFCGVAAPATAAANAMAAFAALI